MKRILIAGGAGFIGSNLCKRLLKENNYIICLDNLYTGSLSNIKEFIENDNFEFINHDIIFPLEIDSIDEIYNLACPASPPRYQKSPTYTTKTAVLGTINLLDIATKYNAKIMQFSTSEVYGNPLTNPQSENYFGNVNPIGIRACYDEGKRVAETLCFDYNREFNTRIKVIRIFNSYGPMMDLKDGRAVSNIITQALKNENITINGNGLQTRSFCYIDDLIDGIILTMNTSDEFKGPLNLGNPEEVTINQLVSLILSKIKTTSEIVYGPLPQDDPLQRKPNISLAEKIISPWKPKIELEKGLQLTIDYFKKIIVK